MRQTNLDSSGSGEVYVVVEGSCKHGNEASGFIKYVTLMTLKNYWLPKDSVQWD